MKKYISKENNPKSPKNLTLFLFLNSFSLYGNYNDKRGMQQATSQVGIFKLPNMLRRKTSLVIHHLAIFDTLIQRGFWIIQKLQLVIYRWHILWHYIINQFSIFSFNLKMLARKNENYKNLNISRIKIAKNTLWQMKYDKE